MEIEVATIYKREPYKVKATRTRKPFIYSRAFGREWATIGWLFRSEMQKIWQVLPWGTYGYFEYEGSWYKFKLEKPRGVAHPYPIPQTMISLSDSKTKR